MFQNGEIFTNCGARWRILQNCYVKKFIMHIYKFVVFKRITVLHHYYTLLNSMVLHTYTMIKVLCCENIVPVSSDWHISSQCILTCVQ